MTGLTAKASQLIRCSPGAAFDAFVDPATITRFWLESTSGALSLGAEVTWHFKVPGAVESVRVDEVRPPSLIAFTWSDGLKVRLEFREFSPGHTCVSAAVEGFKGDDEVDQAMNATEGFSIVLCDLKTLLETGRSAGLVQAKAELIAASRPLPEAIERRSDARHRVISASPAAVFAAMADPERLARWWGPSGFTTTIHTFEFQPGGRWSSTMHGPDGTAYPNESRISQIEADRLFEIEHLNGHHFVLTLELHPHPNGTDVRWRQTFDTVAQYEKLAGFVATANEQNLERLEAEVLHLEVRPTR